jgi:5-methylcytosine-specific restriction protein A
MTRRSMTTLRRARIFDAAQGVCHICGITIDGTREKWEADHKTALEISGDDTDDNLAPAHVHCHKAKTKQDVAIIAKCRRVHAKHVGAARTKKKMPYRRFDGTIVWPENE